MIGKQVISLLSESVWMASTKRASPGSRRSSGLALVYFGPAGSRAETWWTISGNQLHFSLGEFGAQQVIVWYKVTWNEPFVIQKAGPELLKQNWTCGIFHKKQKQN